MANNLLYAQNKIKLVNKCLEAIGEMPLEDDTLTEDITPGTDAYVALNSINDATLEVLNEGWMFNTDKKIKFIPDLNGKIGIPSNILNIDGGNYNRKGDLVIKNGQLYSIYNKSFEFDKPVYLDVVWFVDYDNMPINVFNYIGAKASNRFQSKIIGDKNMYQVLAQEEAEWRMKVEQEEFRNQDYSLVINKYR
jgi:hypothetical protein